MSALCLRVRDNRLLRDYAEGSNHPQHRPENGRSMNLLGKFVLGFFSAVGSSQSVEVSAGGCVISVVVGGLGVKAKS